MNDDLPTWESLIATAWAGLRLFSDIGTPAYQQATERAAVIVALAAELRLGGRGLVVETAAAPKRAPLTLRWDAKDLMDGNGEVRGWLDAQWGWVAHGVTSADDETGPGPMSEPGARAALVAYWTERGYRMRS